MFMLSRLGRGIQEKNKRAAELIPNSGIPRDEAPGEALRLRPPSLLSILPVDRGAR
jgi:hypothetical protein